MSAPLRYAMVFALACYAVASVLVLMRLVAGPAPRTACSPSTCCTSTECW